MIFKNMMAHYSKIGIAVMFSRIFEKYWHFCECYNLEMEILLDRIPAMVVMSAKHPLTAKEKIRLVD